MTSKKIFIDSDVLLDLLQKREPFFKYSQDILELALKKRIEPYTSSVVIANINYVLTKALKNKAGAKDTIKALTKILTVLSVDSEDIQFALNGPFTDFEDGIQHSVALRNHCDAIITRNIKDYKNSIVPVLTAEQLSRITK